MGTGNTKDNYKFFEGFNDEPEIILEAQNTDLQILHIWDGYFDDILQEPNLDGRGWLGFTRDYQQCDGAFGENSEDVITDISEYLDDLRQYKHHHFDYNESRDVYNLLCFWLENAIKKGCKKLSIKIV